MRIIDKEYYSEFARIFISFVFFFSFVINYLDTYVFCPWIIYANKLASRDDQWYLFQKKNGTWIKFGIWLMRECRRLSPVKIKCCIFFPFPSGLRFFNYSFERAEIKIELFNLMHKDIIRTRTNEFDFQADLRNYPGKGERRFFFQFRLPFLLLKWNRRFFLVVLY